jgi:hypothetical protein
MKLFKRISIIVLGTFLPIILSVSSISNVLADTGGDGNIFNNGRSNFSDGQWLLSQECGEAGVSLKRGNNKPLTLLNEKTEVRNGKKIYTWVKKGTQYKITWNPRDPEFARLQIISPSGVTIVNTLLKVGSLPAC